jgi:serine/threonine-protein kinase
LGAAVTGSTPDIFISYKAEDRARLVPLVEALEAEGFSVWWDRHIGGGARWREDIREHLEAARCVIVAWTHSSTGPEGDFVCDEASRARRRGTYLPIRLDPVEPPLGFGEIQSLSLEGWHGERSDPRFEALAGAIRERIAGEPIVHRPSRRPRPRLSRRAVIGGGIGIGAAAIAGVGGWLLLKPAPANAKRIAVMPFANLSNNPEQAYFSEGIAEELRAALSRIGLEVIGRSSSAAVKDLDAKAAAAKLGVANILTGSVRRSPGMIRISAQLVSGRDGVERWAQSYDRAPGDSIKIQSDIAASVAQALNIALGQAGRAAIALGGTADSRAQDFLLQARKVYRESSSEEGARRSVALADKALARDANYAEAYITKSLALSSMAAAYASDMAVKAATLDLAAAAAERALRVAPQLGSAHAALAQIEASRANIAGVKQHVLEALAASPDDPEVLVVVGKHIALIIDGEQGLRVADRSLSLDPLNARAYRRQAEVLKVLRRYADAIASAQRALELAPDAFAARVTIGDSLVALGRYTEARAQYRLMPGDDIFRLIGEGLIAARTGDRAGAEQAVARARKIAGALASFQYAEIYAQLGDRDRAFEALETAVAVEDSGLPYLKMDPFLDPLRGDKRYAALLRKLNFP